MHFLSKCLGTIILASSLFILLSYGQESFFPEIHGWKLMQDDLVYDSNNLWDIIDGAADLYLEYAFINLHIARYISADSIEVKAELYRHGSVADAFGIYSQERDPGYNFIQIGTQGYLQQGVLNYFDGLYYIKLSTYQTGNTGQQALQTIAKKIEEYVKQNNSWPEVLRLFPSEGKLPNTEQYIARNFLGYGFFHSVYVASYKDSTSCTMFIIETESPKQSITMMTEYLTASSKYTVTKLGTKKYEIHDAHNGLIVVAVQKNFLYGLINYVNERTRENFLQTLNACLSK